MNIARRLLLNRWVRLVIMILVVGATLGVFTSYLATHPDAIDQVLSLSPISLVLLTLAYTGTILANAFVLSVSLKMIGKQVGFLENASLTGYSSIVNFFGPLQSGPGVRAAYLKQRHGVEVKKFIYATLVFYGFFASINVLTVLVALLLQAPGNLIPLYVFSLLLMSVSAIALVLNLSTKARSMVHKIRLNDRNFWLIGIGALALSLCTSFAYFIELRHVDAAIDFTQAIVYGAAANLALFVSLTPGAIGFRESFLLLTQRIHQIPSDVVLAASIIDRAFYVVFLLVLFLVLLAIGARAKLLSNNSR